jgi:hypothetical protein
MELVKFGAVSADIFRDVHFPNRGIIKRGTEIVFGPFQLVGVEVSCEIKRGILPPSVCGVGIVQFPMGCRNDSLVYLAFRNCKALAHFKDINFTSIWPADLVKIGSHRPKSRP